MKESEEIPKVQTVNNDTKFIRVTNENGELGLFVPINQGHKVVSREQSEGYKKKLISEEMKSRSRGRNWVACYHDPIKDIAKKMQLQEAGALIKLLPYLKFNSEGILIKDKKPLKLKDIQEIIKRGKTVTAAILDRLEELQVIFKQQQGRSNAYGINEAFHTMGKVIEKSAFTKLYQVRTKEILEPLSLNEAGLLYKALPYFHYQSFHLCLNPDEKDPMVIHHINHEMLSEIIELDPKNVYSHIKKLMGHGVIMKTQSANNTHYMVHPDVMFRTQVETEYAQAIRKLFEEHLARKERQKSARMKAKEDLVN